MKLTKLLGLILGLMLIGISDVKALDQVMTLAPTASPTAVVTNTLTSTPTVSPIETATATATETILATPVPSISITPTPSKSTDNLTFWFLLITVGLLAMIIVIQAWPKKDEEGGEEGE